MNNNSCDFALSKSIVLVGPMGAGKSSIGKRLAKELELPFYDSDEQIEISAGCSTADIYELWGEKIFRKEEKKVIEEMINGEICVLSTGDGAFLMREIKELILEKSLSIWINADVETLYKRVVHRNTKPQALDPENLMESLKKLFNERNPIYRQAHLSIESFDEPYKVTVGRILQIVREYFTSNSSITPRATSIE